MLFDKADRRAQLQAVELDTLHKGCIHDSGHDRWLLEMATRGRPRNDSQRGKCNLLPSPYPTSLFLPRLGARKDGKGKNSSPVTITLLM